MTVLKLVRLVQTKMFVENPSRYPKLSTLDEEIDFRLNNPRTNNNSIKSNQKDKLSKQN